MIVLGPNHTERQTNSNYIGSLTLAIVISWQSFKTSFSKPINLGYIIKQYSKLLTYFGYTCITEGNHL